MPSSLSNRFDFSFYESRFFVLFVDDHCRCKIEKPVFVPNPIYINTLVRVANEHNSNRATPIKVTWIGFKS